jgi:hypothetical protein
MQLIGIIVADLETHINHINPINRSFGENSQLLKVQIRDTYGILSVGRANPSACLNRFGVHTETIF